MSASNSEPAKQLDPRWIGMIDAKYSGWFLQDTSELFRGFRIGEEDYVLDVGCGDGPATMFCADKGAHVTFTDVEDDSVRLVETKIKEQGKARGYKGVVCDSDPLLVESGKATRVICREVLEHVEDPKQVVDELVRAGKPGALYLITVPGEVGEKIQEHFAPQEYFSQPNHIRIFTKEEFTTLVEGSGLQIESYTANGFFWVFWMCMHWIHEARNTEATEGHKPAVHATIKPPFHEDMHRWADLWNSLIQSPEGVTFKQQMDELIPKNQVIVARKPE